MVELIINGNQVELPKNSNIKFTKQISDIFDLSNVSVSFSNSFSFDKTPVNTQTMQQAGISGDNSAVPYQRNNAILKYNGFDVVSNGWFNLMSTDDNYTGSIIDGMIDFFKAIENKTMGLDLDLSNFEHTKDLNSVILSFNNEYYNYIVADYGGKLVFNDGINIDYLAPCFSVKKMWELIFSTFGYICDYNNLSYLDGLYITYPKDIAETESLDLIAELIKDPYTSLKKSREYGGFVYLTETDYQWDDTIITEGSLSGRSFIIPETGSYNFNLEIEMYVTYRRNNFYDRRLDSTVTVLKNGVAIGVLLSNYEEGDTVGDIRYLDFNLGCDAGDVITLEIKAYNRKDFRDRYFYMYQWRHNKTIFKISKSNLGSTSLANELKDFLIKDFIKETIWRTGTTPILEKENKEVKFTTLDSRIDFDNAQDLSHTFKQRRSETYQNDYAQKNIFALKRNDENDRSGDGFLYVPNVNIQDEKTIVQSKIYAPDKRILTSDFFGIQTNQYKIWETETRETDTNEIELSYKGLTGRFYFIRKEIKSGTFKFTSEILADEENASNIPVGINTNTLFEEAVYNNYAEYQKIFNNFRIHNIDLVLTINDFIGLDLTRPVFFKQENAFYICNKIPFEEGKDSLGEFIKINKI